MESSYAASIEASQSKSTLSADSVTVASLTGQLLKSRGSVANEREKPIVEELVNEISTRGSDRHQLDS